MVGSLINFGICLSLIGVVVSAFVGLCAKRNSRAASWVLGCAGVFGTCGALVFLFQHDGGTTQKIVGPFPFAFGLQFGLNTVSGIFFGLLSFITTVVGVYSTAYLKNYAQVYNIKIVQFLVAIFVLGMQGVLLSNNAFGFMFFWEVMSLASFFLVMTERTHESIAAAFQYFVMTHLGGMALFGGFMLLGGGVFAAPVVNIFVNAGAVSHGTYVSAALLFLFGFGSKAGLVPFHVWLPEAYPQAPSSVSALMSGLTPKMAVYGFIVTVGLAELPHWFALTVILFGALSAVYGVLYSIVEKDLKRALAYSSIENMGIIFMMLGTHLYFGHDTETAWLISNLALLLAVFHAINHALFKSGLFMAAGTIISQVHSKSMEQMGGLAKRMPLFSFAMLLLVLAAAALPPFGTFFSEWGFAHALVNGLASNAADLTVMARGLLIFLLAVCSFVGGLAIFAMVKLFAIPMLGAPRSEHAEQSYRPAKRMTFAVGILALGVVATGIFAHKIMNGLVGNPAYEVVYGENVAHAPTSSVNLFLFCVIILLVVFTAYHFMSAKNVERIRIYKTWDCGQPITAGMEYTATAFSAPIRFFFRALLRTHKEVVAMPITATNPWILRRTFMLDVSSVWYEKIYRPIAAMFALSNVWARKIQSGRIQFYLLLIFVALVVTLIVAL